MKRIQNVFFIAALLAGFFLIMHLGARANEAQEQADPNPSFARTVSFSPDNDLLQAKDLDVESGAAYTVDGATAIRATMRISIPYGFETPLPVLADGRDVIASGHGGCTADEQVTIAVTITQSASGAAATGETVQTCTGELQTWSAMVTVDTTSSFASGAAEACGLATTSSGGYVTDSFDWCRDVELLRLERQIFVPVIWKP
jgi:hypothetical protein